MYYFNENINIPLQIKYYACQIWLYILLKLQNILKYILISRIRSREEINKLGWEE